jgi:hypothetical protein
METPTRPIFAIPIHLDVGGNARRFLKELTDSAEAPISEGNSVASASENIQQPPVMDQAVRTQNPLLIDQKSEHGSGDAMAGNHVENPGWSLCMEAQKREQTIGSQFRYVGSKIPGGMRHQPNGSPTITSKPAGIHPTLLPMASKPSDTQVSSESPGADGTCESSPACPARIRGIRAPGKFVGHGKRGNWSRKIGNP